jgi:formate/nitrite transporter FocA (FNT family)
MTHSAIILFQATVDEKLKSAPNDNYAIGVWIGNIIPFVLLVALAYYMYYKAKKRENE